MKKLFFLFITILFSSYINAQNLTLDNLIKIRSSESVNFINFLTNRGWEFVGSTENSETGDESFSFKSDNNIFTEPKSLSIIVGSENGLQYNYIGKGISQVLINRAKKLGYKLIKSKSTQGIDINVFSNGKLVILFTGSFNEDYGKYLCMTMIINKSVYDKKLKNQF